MIAIFYDRKNRYIVRSDQLMSTKLVEMGLTVDTEGASSGRWEGRKKQPAYLKEEIISTIAYKSKDCPRTQNWDMHTTINDLVLLDLKAGKS